MEAIVWVIGLAVIAVVIHLINEYSRYKQTLISFEDWLYIYNRANWDKKYSMTKALVKQSLLTAKKIEPMSVDYDAFVAMMRNSGMTEKGTFEYWMSFCTDDDAEKSFDIEACRFGAMLYFRVLRSHMQGAPTQQCE